MNTVNANLGVALEIDRPRSSVNSARFVNRLMPKFTKLAPAYVEAVNRWSSYGGLQMTVDEKSFTAQLVTMPRLKQISGWQLALSVNGKSVNVTISNSHSLFPWMSGDYSDEPSEIISALIADDIAPHIAQIARAIGSEIMVLSIKRSTLDCTNECLMLRALDAEGKAAADFYFSGDLDSTLPCIDAAFDAMGFKDEATHLAVPVKLYFELGNSNFAVHDLNSLETGDVLRIEHWHSRKGKLQVLGRAAGIRHGLFLANVNDLEITVDSGEIMTDKLSASNADTQTGSEDIARFNQLEINIGFSLDERVLALSELKNIRPGYVFNLQQSVEESLVKIIANGQDIGRGQLVAVGECLGIRITRFINHVQ